MTPEERAKAEIDELAWTEGLDFANGVIEAEVAGVPVAGAPEGALNESSARNGAGRSAPVRENVQAFMLPS
jgi:hypothetical protein